MYNHTNLQVTLMLKRFFLNFFFSKNIFLIISFSRFQEDTISINHNWFNGCNIEHIWKCLYQAAVEVENEISDIKEFEGWEDQWQVCAFHM